MSNKTLTERFIDYVKISSESGNELEICNKVCDDLKKYGVSFETFSVDSDYKTNGYNIYAYIKGKGNPILFNGHVDTVAPGNNVNPIIENGLIKSDGTTVLGADDKTAIACIIHLLANLPDNHRDIEVLITVGEESGLCGIKAFDKSIIKSKIAYTLDSSNPVGGMIVAAPSNIRMDIDIVGKSAHAGRVPEQGISAIQCASKAIAEIPLLRIDEETTCNIGTFKSEFANNVVPDKAFVSLAMRSLNEAKLNAQADKVKKAFNKYCDAKIRCFQSYKAYIKDDNNESVKLAKQAMLKAGITPFDVKACGGSDAHILNEYGFDALNLACGNEKVHSLNECIKIEQLELAYKLVKSLSMA